MTSVLLIRHGQSTWNAEGRWQGQSDPELSDVGRMQAITAARHVGAVDAIVSSDLRRARETAEILADALGVGPVVVDESLRERDAGEWTGLTRHEIEQRWPGALGERRYPAGYESEPSILERMIHALALIHRQFEGASVLAVSHGGVIRALERFLGRDEPPLPNMAGRWVDVGDQGMDARDRVLLIDPDEVELTIPKQI